MFIRLISLAFMAFMPLPGAAEMVVATRVLPAQTILAASDLGLIKGQAAGSLANPDEAVGLETRVTLYPGRPIKASQLGPPAVVERNQIVFLAVQMGALRIETEGRAMSRGGVGEIVRVMNLHSRKTISGRVQEDGSILVSP